jgi:ariadne-1
MSSDYSDMESAYMQSEGEFEYDDGPTPENVVIRTSQEYFTPSELQEELFRLVNEVSDLLSVSFDVSLILLQRNRWKPNLCQEEWFNRGGGDIQYFNQILPHQYQDCNGSQNSFPCNICLEEDQVTKYVACHDMRHVACETCWDSYLNSKISDGRSAIHTKCPGAKCPVPVGLSVFKKFLSSEDFAKYMEMWTMRFAEESNEYKFCMNSESCPYVLRVTSEINGLICPCGFVSCNACNSESHEPASCEDAKNWDIKNSSESENCKWILLHTKPCPNCGKPIEKNQGCNHMTCQKGGGGCGHHFCWICLIDWKKHAETSNPYKCNIYQASETEEKDRKKLQDELNRYLFYFERYQGHNKASKIAKLELNRLNRKIQIIHDHYKISVVDLQFLRQAITQVISCRNILKYTYVYGYYLSQKSDSKELFEHLQKNLEEKTDRLHEYIEKDFDTVVLQLDPSEITGNYKFEEIQLPEDIGDPFQLIVRLNDFQSKVNNLTSVVDKFMKSIINDLQEGGLKSNMNTPR